MEQVGGEDAGDQTCGGGQGGGYGQGSEPGSQVIGMSPERHL